MKRAFTRKFRKQLDSLPRQVRRLAVKNYLLWRENPLHPSIRWKTLARGVWSARIGGDYRAVAYVDGNIALWVWIGSHNDFDAHVRRLIAQR